MDQNFKKDLAHGAWGKVGIEGIDEKFLEGPHRRSFELFHALRIFWEFIRGFRGLHFVGPCVTVFGSARIAETSSYYSAAREIGALLAKTGFTVMTGGGPGVMEAANRGAKDVHGKSIGCNIKLPSEQKPNQYLDRWIEFDHFFVRKVMLLKYSYAFIALPGGYGTLDEVFETATLIQTRKIKNFPLILIGRDYWQPLIGFLKERLLANRAIDDTDMEIFTLTDSPEEAIEVIRKQVIDRFGLKYRVKPRRLGIYFER